MSETTTCAVVRDAAPELALGVLVGAERATVLAHLDTCADCRAEVQGFSAAVDAVFQLAPEADPPAGFEVRLLARRAEAALTAGAAAAVTGAPASVHAIGSGRPRRSATQQMRALAAAAAVVLVGAGIAIGTVVSSGGSQPHLAAVRSAELSSGGIDRGTVVVAAGHPSWVFMNVQDVAWSGWVRCVVTERGGREVTVGRFLLHGGYGGWAVPLKLAPGSVVGARLELDDGTTLAVASLPA